MIQWIRYRYQIPKAKLVRPEELTVQQVAERFRVSPNVVYYWIERNIVQAQIEARGLDLPRHQWARGNDGAGPRKRISCAFRSRWRCRPAS